MELFSLFGVEVGYRDLGHIMLVICNLSTQLNLVLVSSLYHPKIYLELKCRMNYQYCKSKNDRSCSQRPVFVQYM